MGRGRGRPDLVEMFEKTERHFRTNQFPISHPNGIRTREYRGKEPPRPGNWGLRWKVEETASERPLKYETSQWSPEPEIAREEPREPRSYRSSTMCPDCKGQGGEVVYNPVGDDDWFRCEKCVGIGYIITERIVPDEEPPEIEVKILPPPEVRVPQRVGEIIECYVCKGEGTLTLFCTRCRGSGRYAGGNCPLCEGTAKRVIDCTICHGARFLIMHRDRNGMTSNQPYRPPPAFEVPGNDEDQRVQWLRSIAREMSRVIDENNRRIERERRGWVDHA